jgi:hypothetical protein
MITAPKCVSRQADFHGWNACYLENGLVRLVAVPDIGGRIMACDLGSYPFFFVDPDLAGKLFTAEENQGDGSLAAWKNYGGDKTWPAPQGWDRDDQWHGPPDPILDSGRYTLNEMSSDGEQAAIRMTSPPDPRTGVQITRHFTLRRSSSRVLLEITFHNTKQQPIRWSLWDVAQLRAERRLPDGRLTYEPGCVITAPVNPNSRHPAGYHVIFGEPDNPQWQVDPASGLFTAPYLWQIGKVGLDSTAGWIAFSNTAAGYAFTETFPCEPGADYPDNGSSLEVWTIGAGEVGNLNYEDSGIYLMETEVLSPLRTIPPGEATSFRIEWGLCRCEGAVIDVAPGGAVVDALRAVAQDTGFVEVTGRFGVFDTGELRASWLGSGGENIETHTLAMVDPLTAITLDRVFQRPTGAARIEIEIIAAGGDRRLLAGAEITRRVVN